MAAELTSEEIAAGGYTPDQVAAINADRRKKAQENAPGGSGGFSFGDLLTYGFWGMLGAAIVGGLGLGGLFGDGFGVMVKGLINKIAEAFNMDPIFEKPVEEFLTATAADPAKFKELLQNETFGAGLSEESAAILATEGPQLLKALKEAGVDLEKLQSDGLSVIQKEGVLNKLARSNLSLPVKQTLFYESLVKQNISPKLARELANQTEALLLVVNDGTKGIDLEALIREGVGALKSKSMLAMLQGSPELAKLMSVLPEASQSAILAAAGYENVKDMLVWLNQPSEIAGASNMQVLTQSIKNMNLSEADMKEFEALVSKVGTAFSSGNAAQIKEAVNDVFNSPLLKNEKILPEFAAALQKMSLPALTPEQMKTLTEATGKNAAEVTQMMADAKAVFANTGNLRIFRDLTLSVGPQVSNAVVDMVMPSGGGKVDMGAVAALAGQHIDKLAPLAKLDVSAIRDPQTRALAEASLHNLGALVSFAEKLTPQNREKLSNVLASRADSKDSSLGSLLATATQLLPILQANPEGFHVFADSLKLDAYATLSDKSKEQVAGIKQAIDFLKMAIPKPQKQSAVDSPDKAQLAAADAVKDLGSKVALSDSGAPAFVPSGGGSAPAIG